MAKKLTRIKPLLKDRQPTCFKLPDNMEPVECGPQVIKIPIHKVESVTTNMNMFDPRIEIVTIPDRSNPKSKEVFNVRPHDVSSNDNELTIILR